MNSESNSKSNRSSKSTGYSLSSSGSNTMGITNEISCIKNGFLAPSVKIMNKFIPGVYKGYDTKKKQNVIVKQLNTITYDLIKSCDYSTDLPIESSVWTEITALKLCTLLVKNGVCPNLPTLYGYTFCEKCGPTKHEEQGRPCIYMQAEFIPSGSFKQWVLNNPHDIDEWHNAYSQIFIALYALQKYFDLTHHDLHWENVLVMKTNPGGYWIYEIDGDIYYIPNLGYKFVLWDFEFAWIPGKIEPYALRGYHKKQQPRYLLDYFRISHSYSWGLNEGKPKEYFPPELDDLIYYIQKMCFEKGIGLNKMLPVLLEPYKTKDRGNILARYSLDTKINPEDMSLFFNIKQIRVSPPTPSQRRYSLRINKSSTNPFRQNQIPFVNLNQLKSSKMKSMSNKKQTPKSSQKMSGVLSSLSSLINDGQKSVSVALSSLSSFIIGNKKGSVNASKTNLVLTNKRQRSSSSDKKTKKMVRTGYTIP